MFHLNLIIFQIKGEYQFNYPELALLLVEDQEWGKVIYSWRGASYAVLNFRYAVTVYSHRVSVDANVRPYTDTLKRMHWF